MLKAIIFDFDGVIQNFPEIVWRERKIFLRNHKVHLEKADLEILLGLTLEEQVIYINKKFKLSLVVDDLKKHRESISEIVDKEVKILEGVEDLILLLKNKKIKMAIASNKPLAAIERDLKKFNIYSKFDLILGKEDVKKPKPDPEIFFLAAKKLHVKPEECIMIEDAPYGIQGAKKAGMKTIGLYSSFHSSFPEADLCIKSLKELSWQKLSTLYSR
ncbi:MAG: HAD family phosphatase [bacterium]|nr:HAD family phosphatase [bacterium]